MTEGNKLNYSIELNSDEYHLKGYGPNGFFREFKGISYKNEVSVKLNPVANPLHLQFLIANSSKEKLNISIVANSYKKEKNEFKLKNAAKEILLDLKSTSGWYDFSVKIAEYPEFEQRFAGHVENGKVSSTDPLMGGVLQYRVIVRILQRFGRRIGNQLYLGLI